MKGAEKETEEIDDREAKASSKQRCNFMSGMKRWTMNDEVDGLQGESLK
jgi:hypothetical protein